MCEKEFYKVASMSYVEYCDYLQGKYGKSKYNYFSTNWSRNPKVSRTKEGLFTHHKYENQGIMLSEAKYAKNNPYEWQLAENLVYCNYLEHLLLHIKIFKEDKLDLRRGIITGVGGVVNFLVPTLNDIYSGWEPKQDWQKNCVAAIINNFDVYLLILAAAEDTTCIRKLFGDKWYKKSYNANFGSWSDANNEKIYRKIQEKLLKNIHGESL